MVREHPPPRASAVGNLRRVAYIQHSTTASAMLLAHGRRAMTLLLFQWRRAFAFRWVRYAGIAGVNNAALLLLCTTVARLALLLADACKFTPPPLCYFVGRVSVLVTHRWLPRRICRSIRWRYRL